MTFLTKLMFYLHFVTGVGMIVSPSLFESLVHGRPSLTTYAIEPRAGRHEQMLYLYERIAASFQMFLGMSGMVSGVENWYTSLALLVYDGYHAYELYQFKERAPNQIERLDETIGIYAFGALVGLVGFLSRVNKGIKVDREAMQNEYILTRIQAMIAPISFAIELLMAFPLVVNLFDIGGSAFQKMLLKDGKLLLELQCHRLIIGFLAVLILNTGAAVARDIKIAMAFIVTHLAIGLSMLMFTHRVFPNQSTDAPGPVGFDTPAFLHFAVAFSNTLSFSRALKNREFYRANPVQRPKQE